MFVPFRFTVVPLQNLSLPWESAFLSPLPHWYLASPPDLETGSFDQKQGPQRALQGSLCRGSRTASHALTLSRIRPRASLGCLPSLTLT